MDLATIVGLLGGIGVIVTLILMGGSASIFYDIHAVIIIFGGCGAATMIRFPFATLVHGLPMGLRYAFAGRSMQPRELIDELTKIAEVVKKSGPIALENVTTTDPFLAQGIRYIADGYDLDFIRNALEKDRDQFLTALDEGQKIYRAIGDSAPAWGMVGTLIGMVQMFANMEDPSKLGPFMAVSLLATLYGALVGNLLCSPIADKLHVKLEEEEIGRTIIIDGILQIRESRSASLVREMLMAYLPSHHRETSAEAA